MYGTCSITDGGGLTPMTDAECAAIAIDFLRDHVMLQPLVTVLIEHLMMDPGWQVDGVSRLDGITLTIEQRLSRTGQDVVHLLEIFVLMMIGGLTPLEGMARKSTESLQAIPFVIGIAVDVT